MVSSFSSDIRGPRVQIDAGVVSATTDRDAGRLHLVTGADRPRGRRARSVAVAGDAAAITGILRRDLER
uniref:Uncharacterized protein n=1 Tax=Leersia perrieri TaxID=77586 RepID=A0A0D9VRI1_9ORYZ